LSAGALAAAASATERSGSATTAATPAAAAASLADLKQRVKANPKDVPSWLALAELYRSSHDNANARDALVKVMELNGMTAQSWADYADVLASLAGGSFSGPAISAIDKALSMDPANPKALWLKGSQAHEAHQYKDAIAWWTKLRAALPADSPDAAVITNNIAEDSSLAGLPPPAAPQTAAAALSGTVSLDSRFAARVQRDATLFIYAKAADSPGPPLAVLRTTAASWPVSFHLDDSMAMIPSRKLSQFDKVIVEARISRSGQATPASGDLYVTSPVLHPDASKKLDLVINREIG
jgi:cytochrome c-type biogenesis protein CcmH